MVIRMKARTPSGVRYRVSARPNGLGRWAITVQRLHGVTKPVVHEEIVTSLLPPISRMRALAAEAAARSPHTTMFPHESQHSVPQPRVVRDRVRA